MTRLLRSEILKLRTTRTFWVLAIGALVVAAGGAGAIAATIAPVKSITFANDPARQVLSLAGPAQTLTLLLGALAVGNEYRHGTITPALLLTPRRTQLLVAKVITLGLVGLVIGIVAFGEAAAIALPILSSRHVGTGMTVSSVLAIDAGGALATGFFAVMGVALGAVIRNQVGAIITALCLIYVAEPLLSVVPSVGGAVQRFGLGGLTSGASATNTGFPSNAHYLAQPEAILVLAGYTLVLSIAGAGCLSRLDIEG
jgi:ABC-2 type transport system permease protein